MWRKGNPCALLVGMKIGTAIVEKIMEGPQKIRNRNTTQQPHLSIYIYIQRKQKQDLKEVSALPCLFQYYSQEPRSKNNLSVWQQIKMCFITLL